MTFNYLPQSNAKIKNRICGVTPVLPLYAFTAWTGKNYPSFYLCYLFMNMWFDEMKIVVEGVVRRNHGMAVRLNIYTVTDAKKIN
jgi:hypothetical protein